MCFSRLLETEHCYLSAVIFSKTHHIRLIVQFFGTFVSLEISLRAEPVVEDER